MNQNSKLTLTSETGEPLIDCDIRGVESLLIKQNKESIYKELGILVSNSALSDEIPPLGEGEVG